MKKVAKLVRVSLVTRVIVYENATEEEILELAIPKLSESLMDSPYQNVDEIVDEIVDDTECPYDEGEDVGLILSEVKALSAARWVLATSSDEELIEMIKLIINHNNKEDLIDNIEGVDVWLQVENTYSASNFLENIGYTGKEFKN